MRGKWLAVLGIGALAVAIAGPADAQSCPKGKLKIYTSWPMQGAMIPESTGMKNGVDLAIADAGGVVAGYCLEVVNLDDASPQTGKWDGAVEAENANKAVADPLAIVYIGTYNSGAAKVSIPINNRANMAQITPANTYPGLTKKRGAAPGEPEIYRPVRLRELLPPRAGRRHPGRGRGEVGEAARAQEGVHHPRPGALRQGDRGRLRRRGQEARDPGRRQRGHRLQATRPEARPDQGPGGGRRPDLHGRRRRHGRPDRDPRHEGARSRRPRGVSSSSARTASSRRRS